MRSIQVEFKDGTIINTNINGTNEEIEAYYTRDIYGGSKLFDVGTYPKENMQSVKRIKFFD